MLNASRSRTGIWRRERLGEARLYFVCEARPGGRPAGSLLEAALAGGVDMVQLRDKEASDEELLQAAAEFRDACERHDALFWVNDRPELALAAGADGVHLGQDDMPVAEARERVGPELLVGLSTHSPEQFDAGLRSGADELSVGPIYETPTKEGRPPTGLDYVRYAARRGGELPWFVIGGITHATVGAVLARGARRVVVVRAIRDASDARAAAAALKSALEEAGGQTP